MDELIVRIAKAIACMSRLRVLSVVSRVDEISPSRLAEKLKMSRALVSSHLYRLGIAGLVRRRRSGAWHYCRSGSPYSADTLSGQLAAWLEEALGNTGARGEHSGVKQLRNVPPRRRDSHVRRLVLDAAAAFTSVRRLQILRRLCAGAADAATLRRELHMSPPAASRHTAKLVRCGYVVASGEGRGLVYQLAARFHTPLHARLFEIVREHW